MKELNKLTEELISQGYTKENYPAWVKPWNEFYGGFEYTIEYKDKMVFETPCGMVIKGSHWNSGYMSYMGVNWTLENDCPTINCPYKKIGCKDNHKLLKNSECGGGTVKFVFCACHKTTKEYKYEISIDKVINQREDEIEQKFSDFQKTHKRVCQQMCRFSEYKNSWVQSYDPTECQRFCNYCSILKISFSGKKGNVFYDIYTTTEIKGVGLFQNEFKTIAIKDKRYFEKPMPIEVCEVIADYFKDKIISKEKARHNSEIYFNDHHNVFFKLEVKNIRAEIRCARDLEKDLEDISNGIAVVHQSDLIIGKKSEKRQRKEVAQNAKIKKYLLLLSQNDIENIDKKYKYKIIKAIEKGLITEEDILNAKKCESGEQLSLF